MRVELDVSLLVEPDDIVEDDVSVDEAVPPLVVPEAPSVDVLELVLGVLAEVEPLAPIVEVLGVLELDVLAFAPPWPALAVPEEPLVPVEAELESLPDAEPPAEAPPPAATATPPIARAAAAASVVTIFFMSWTP